MSTNSKISAMKARLLIQNCCANRQAGFSLLELMVVFSLTTVMAGGGFFAFTQYARSQSFNQGIEKIRLTYEQARNYAISNVKPEDECSSAGESLETLRGYRVDLEEDQIILVTRCTDNASNDTEKASNLPAGVKLRNLGGGSPTACSGVEFKVISGNVQPTGGGALPCAIEIYHEEDSESLVKRMEIAQDGRISINEVTP